MRTALLAAGCWFFVVACASAPPPLAAPPQWEIVPAGVTDLLCARLQMDALATGTVAAVRITQPIVTQEALTSLRATAPSGRGPRGAAAPQFVNRAIPVAFGQRCSWRPLEVFDKRRADEMVVEFSAPIINPVIPSEAGMFARATLGGEHAAWYWISIVPHGPQQWAARWVYVLSR